MKKIKLETEQLAVESFPTQAVEERGGTVGAHVRTINPAQWTCDFGFHTCALASQLLTYCGDPCGNTAVQYYTCKQTCVWP
jgi:hypothetical protein